MRNIAFIDGQNLHLGTGEDKWSVDFERFRIYLKEKYKVDQAYYYFGYLMEDMQELYNNLQKAGFIVVFKEHTHLQTGAKKGNVDTDMVFDIMRCLLEEDFDKVVIVSGDGDYKKIVDYLMKKNRFGKILFPNGKFASSLYKSLGNQYTVNLGRKDVRSKISFSKRRKKQEKLQKQKQEEKKKKVKKAAKKQAKKLGQVKLSKKLARKKKQRTNKKKGA